MIAAIMWKEWRDQRTIAITILTFGALALALTSIFNATHASGQTIMEQAGTRELMALTVAYLAGSVCGSMLLADEKEVGTLEYLDGLPCSRFRLWQSKTAYGLVFTTSMSALVAALAFAFDSVDTRIPWWMYSLFIWMVGMHGFSWGLFGGAIARSTLGAVFQGAVGSFLVGSAIAIPFVLIVGPLGFGRTFSVSLFFYYALWMVSGLVLSALAFTGIDRRRQTYSSEPEFVQRSRGSRPKRTFHFRIVSLLWLSLKQGVWILAGAWVAGLVLGAAMVAPDLSPMLLWPPATLVLGVLAGVTTMSEEQTRGVARFWAERRLPLGRLWMTKVLFHFVIAVGAASIMALPLFAVSPSSPFRTKLLVQVEMGLRTNLGAFLWFGLVYGFVMGHLSGMLFRKTIVAGLFAVLAATILAGFLVPSIVGGGVNRWQIWLPAAMLLLTARAILYPWATERIAYRVPVIRVCSGIALSLAVLAAGILYRVYEIPDSPDLLAESKYAESLQGFDPNDSGRMTRGIAGQYRKASEEANPLLPSRQSALTNNPMPGVDRTQLERASSAGWTPQSQLLKPWLDRVFGVRAPEEWVVRLMELDQRPMGMFENPWELHHFSPLDDVRNLREMLLAIRVRGMQRQAEGDPDSYAKLLRGGLAAVRNARFRGSWRTPEIALESEEVLIGGLFAWLGRLENRPDLLKDVLDSLIRHERDMATGVDDVFWAERVVMLKTFESISTWLPTILDSRPNLRTANRPPSDLEAELVSVAWSMPWERARRERLLRLNSDRNAQIYFSWLSGLHLRSSWRLERMGRLREADRRGLAARRFALIRVALHLYESENPSPAKHLEELVPRYLQEVPADPFSNEKFHYRLSMGETVEYDSNFRIGNMSRPDLLFSELLPAFVHFEKLAEALPGLLRSSSSVPPMTHANTPMPSAMSPYSQNPVRRIVPEGHGILWSVGVDGKNHDAKRNGPFGWGDGPNVDWIMIVPAMRNKNP